MKPQYNTLLFCEVWESDEEFLEEYEENPFPKTISEENAKTLFYLLFAKYCNNPIINLSLDQWKLKVWSLIFQYGDEWAKKLDIQDKLRSLSEDELRQGSLKIYNQALNPSTTPTTQTKDELTYINQQNVNKNKKSVGDAYIYLWQIMRSNTSELFLNRFKNLFKKFVQPHVVFLFEDDEEEDSDVLDNYA